MILLKKAVRSMLENKKAYIACIVLIAMGIGCYVSLGVAVERVEMSARQYYRDYNMADVFGKVVSIPQAAISGLERIEGVEEVSLRIVRDVRVVIPDNDKIITLRLVSLDGETYTNPVNGVLYEGNAFKDETDLWLDRDFLNIHNLELGSSLTLIINGLEKQFTICGTANSPEYIYIIKSLNEFLPDPETFTVGFMPLQALESVLVQQGSFNDVCFTLSGGYTFDDVKVALEDELAKYGLLELYPQKDQISFSMVETEVNSNRAMVAAIPVIFMSMAIIILYLMLKRIVEQDRSQIGTLKAFGYSSFQLLGHYLFYGVVTGFIGGFIGNLLGYWLTGPIGAMYNDFFKLPYLADSPAFSYILKGFAVSVLGGAFGAFMGAFALLRLSPAEAMRPLAPKPIKKDYLKGSFIARLVLSSTGFMAVRSIFRNKLRSFFVVLGITFSFGLLAFMGSYNDMIDMMLMDQYTKMQVYDMKITFENMVGAEKAIADVLNLPGVEKAESILELPVEIIHGHRKEGVIFTGISPDSDLYYVYDNQRETNLPVTGSGVILNNRLAEKLEVSIGGQVYIRSGLLGEDIPVQVSDIVAMNLGGSACFASRHYLSSLFRMPSLASGVILHTSDPEYLKEYLKYGSNIAFLEDVKTTLENYRSFMDSYMYTIYIMEVMAVIIAVAIIYNVSTISLSEQKREYATLRVLGMHVNEVAGIMAFEYWVLCFLGILLGIPFNSLLKQMISSMMDIEAYTFPVTTPPVAYLVGIVGCVASVWAANLSSKKIIGKFDMVEVLKERE